MPDRTPEPLVAIGATVLRLFATAAVLGVRVASRINSLRFQN